MLCPNCGAEVGNDLKLCPQCHTSPSWTASSSTADELTSALEGNDEIDDLLDETLEDSTDSGALGRSKKKTKDNVSNIGRPLEKQAGIILRLAAWIFDFSILLSTFFLLLSLITFHIFNKFFTGLFEILPYLRNSSLEEANSLLQRHLGLGLTATAFLILLLPLLFYINSAFYYSFLESSEAKGTFGKTIVGIEVVGKDGQKVPLLLALFRFVTRFISCISLGLGFLIASITEKKQALHDILNNTYVEIKTGLSFPQCMGRAIIAAIAGPVISIVPWLIIYPAITDSINNSNAVQALKTLASENAPATIGETGSEPQSEIDRILEKDEKFFKEGKQDVVLQERTNASSSYGYLMIAGKVHQIDSDKTIWDKNTSTMEVKLLEKTESGESEHTVSIIIKFAAGAQFAYVPEVTDCKIIKVGQEVGIPCHKNIGEFTLVNEFFINGNLIAGKSIEFELIGNQKERNDIIPLPSARWNMMFSSRLHSLDEIKSEQEITHSQQTTKLLEAGSENKRLPEEDVQVKTTSGQVSAWTTKVEIVDSIAFYRPKYRRLDVGLFSSKLSEAEKREYERRRDLFTNVLGRQPAMILSVSYHSKVFKNELESVDAYAIYLIRDTQNNFHFPGTSNRKTFRRSSALLRSGEISNLTGAFREGSTIAGTIKGGGDIDQVTYKWDVNFSTEFIEID
ncbi:MAG: RDD family protein [bacterium]|nr:RDD family protein [bacterium]